MKNNILYLFLLFFVHNTYYSIAQDNQYLKGYLITAEKDTIEGYIRDDRRIQLSQQFYFKSDLDARPKIFDTKTANGFYLSPATYFEKGKIEINGTLEDRFLEKLVDGYTRLFKYTAEQRNNYLFLKPTGESLQIEKRDSMGQQAYFEDKKYIGEIKYFFKDCSDFITNPPALRYDERSLSKAVVKYNRCVRPEEKGRQIRRSRRLRIGIVPVVGLQRYNIETSMLQAPKIATEDQGVATQFGGLLSAYIFKSISFRTGLLYGKYLSQDEEVFSLETAEISHEIRILEFPLELKYNLNNNKFSPYLVGGVRFGQVLDSNAENAIIILGEVASRTSIPLTFEKVFGMSAGLGLTTQISERIDLNLEATYNYVELFYLTRNDVIIKGPALRLSAHYHIINTVN
ncbi:MAG: outer membrane beta-barrel protein [Bacteroidota bacterium]